MHTYEKVFRGNFIADAARHHFIVDAEVNCSQGNILNTAF